MSRLFQGDGHALFDDTPRSRMVFRVEPTRPGSLFRHVAKSIYENPGYSCPRIAEYGGTKHDEDAWFYTFVHDVEHLLDRSVAFWDVAGDDLDANDNRVWALLLAHAMRQTGDL